LRTILASTTTKFAQWRGRLTRTLGSDAPIKDRE
jgi:hypothetical protein